jgi:hypothetical protein
MNQGLAPLTVQHRKRTDFNAGRSIGRENNVCQSISIDFLISLSDQMLARTYVLSVHASAEAFPRPSAKAIG